MLSVLPFLSHPANEGHDPVCVPYDAHPQHHSESTCYHHLFHKLMDEYASEVEKVRSMIRIGQTLGRDEWVKKNEEYLERLLHIQTELEEKGIVHKSGSMREA